MLSSTLARHFETFSIPAEAITPYGKQIVKLDPQLIPATTDGRVILVTAMTPTPAGEGKTTTSIAIVDALNQLGKKAIGALREPSLGPLFGRKGGAIGGGQSKVVPETKINMHFTGDIHAVTSAHNLLSTLIDNHLYHHNALNFNEDKVMWRRVIDMNDRALRKIKVGFSTKRGPVRDDYFDITAASEVMAILCMSSNLEDLKFRLGEILIGVTKDGEKIQAKDLQAHTAMAAILSDAIQPNLVQTIEGNPVLIHGGPFANIAQGTNTIIQTKLAKTMADYVVTEAGFAFDLGGFKFLDLKCRNAGFLPAAIVLVATVRALRHHGGVDFSAGPNLEAVSKGLSNLEAHIESMKRLGLESPIIAINRFPDDSDQELTLIKERVSTFGAIAIEGDYFMQGGKGALEIAKALVQKIDREKTDMPKYSPTYLIDQPVTDKIRIIAQTLLGATDIELTESAQQDLENIQKLNLTNYPICLAKTHLSISDNKTLLAAPKDFNVKITKLKVSSGAGFIVASCGPILTMPGLPKRPSAADIDVIIDENGQTEVIGLK